MAYINGSDVLMQLSAKAIGHCTSHTLSWSAETKERSVKPPFSESSSSGLWKDKSIVSLSASVSAEGLQFSGESELGYQDALQAYIKAIPVPCKFYHRGEEEPYAQGNFIITSIEESAPAGDDATYSISLENAGAVTIAAAAASESSETPS